MLVELFEALVPLTFFITLLGVLIGFKVLVHKYHVQIRNTQLIVTFLLGLNWILAHYFQYYAFDL